MRPGLQGGAMTSRHPTVERQLREAFPEGTPDVPGLETFLAAVSQAYIAADGARHELEQSLEQMTRLEQVMVERTTELDQRNRNMSLLLNNVSQGFATVDLDGTIRAECSQAFTRWFGAPGGEPIWTLLAGDDANLAAWIQLGFESIHSELMPIDVVLGQLPRRLERNGRQLRVEYQPIGVPLTVILVVASDATDELAREHAEAAQHELLAVVDNAYRDRAGFLAFIRDTNELLREPPGGMALAELKRRVHTLKGNAALYGATSVSEVCHEIESQIDAESSAPDGDVWAVLLDT